MSTNQTIQTDDLEQPTSWAGVIAGLLVFGIATTFLLAAEIRVGFGATAPPTLFALALWGMLIIPPAGFAAGWILGFPRWSYPYAGLAAATALYIANGGTPGLTFFGYPTFGDEVWGWRALIPLAAAFMVGLIVTRSLQPIRTFFAQMAADWTRPAYMMTGFLPLIVFIAFDEVDRRFTFAFELALSVAILLMAGAYLRSTRPGQRVRVLIFGTLAIIATVSISTSLYWYWLGPENIHIPGAIGWMLCISSFLLWPFLFIGATRAMQRLGRAGTS
jgi:hypothetical protein